MNVLPYDIQEINIQGPVVQLVEQFSSFSSPILALGCGGLVLRVRAPSGANDPWSLYAV